MLIQLIQQMIHGNDAGGHRGALLTTLNNTNTPKIPSLPDWSTQPDLAQCCNTAEEALAKGCTFDALAASYLPPHCHSQSLFHDAQEEATSNLLSHELKHPFHPYPTPKTFEWFADNELTDPIDQELIPTLDGFVAFTWERYHIGHCTYMWREVLEATTRVQRGEKGVYVNSRALDEGHMTHCRWVLAEQVRRVGAIARVEFGYGNCTRLS